MPKQTFFNLPAVKRQAIIDLALAEFAQHPYAVASLSQIVARADIAKGSVYQYFEHKQDLYLFILDYAAQEQLALLSAQTPPRADLDFFALLRWQMQASVQVGLSAPLLTRLMYRAVTDELPFRDEVLRRLQSAGGGHLRALLARGVAQGQLDPTVDLELAAFFVERLMAGLHELVIRRLGVSLEQAASDVTVLNGPVTDQLYDQVVHLVQYGLGARVSFALDLGEQS